MQDAAPENWIEPAQKRSKDKVARILDAARSLIVESGSANVKMTEIAKRAGVAVGTLYQFFPTAPGLVEKLFAVEMEAIDASFHVILDAAQTQDQLLDGVEALLQRQLDIVKSRPVLMILLGAAGLHADIQRADFENTQKNARVLTAKILDLSKSDAALNQVETLSMLICHLWSGVVRLALLDEKHDPQHYLDHFSGMIRAYVREI